MTWTPMYCFAAITTIFVISEFLSSKTNGYVSFLVFASIIFAAGYWTGVLPKELVQITGISGIMGVLVMPMIVTNLGASININKMIREWRSVIISLMSVIGILVLCCTVGTAIFGKVYSYSAVGPIAGGLVAATLVQEAANKANAPEIAAFAMVLISVQNMIALPIASGCIKYDLKSKISSGKLEQASKEQASFQIQSVKLFPDIPKHLDTSTMSFFKVALVAALCVLIGNIVPIPATVSNLILGCVLCTVNFLPEAPLKKAGGEGFFMLCVMVLAATSFSGLSPAKFMEMVIPIIGLMALGIIGILVFSVISGKLFKYSPAISIAIGVSALLGYPNTQFVTEEAIKSLDCSDEEKQYAMDYALPKMIVGGFVSVSIASVVLTSIIAPLIFL